MARIKGVDIPDKKIIGVSLTYIYGIGDSLARKICENAKVDYQKRTYDLSNDELNSLRDEVSNYLLEGDLRKEVSMNIKTKKEINSYQGIRHKKNLPVRGQKTRTNARTARGGKGKTVANKKK